MKRGVLMYLVLQKMSIIHFKLGSKESCFPRRRLGSVRLIYLLVSRVELDPRKRSVKAVRLGHNSK